MAPVSLSESLRNALQINPGFETQQLLLVSSNVAAQGYDENREQEFYRQSSGLGATILRANSFMQNFLWFAAEIKSRSTLSLPMGEAKTAPVDIRDVAAVAAATLSGPAQAGVTYNITGPEKLSLAEIAAELSTAIRKDIKYCDVAPAEFLDTLILSGLPNWYARAVAAAWAVARKEEPKISDVVSEVVKKNPISFEQFTRDYASAFARANGKVGRLSHGR